MVNSYLFRSIFHPFYDKMESGVNAGSGAPCVAARTCYCRISVVMGNVPMPHYSVRRSVLVNLDLEVRVCFQQSLLHYPREPSADSLIPSNQSTTFIQTFISCHLDPVFIFKFGMGVKGAALATVISQAVSCAWVIFFLCGKKSVLRLCLKNLSIKTSLVFPCLALGSATFIMQASESVLSVCFNSSLLKYGGDIAVGAMTILTSVMQFALLPLQGIGQGAQPVSSYNYGAGNAPRVRKTFSLLLASCVLFSFVLWIVLMARPQSFAFIFTSDAELVDFTAKALRLYGAALVLMGVQVACQMTFVSIGNTKCSIIVAVVRKFVLLIPLIFIVPLFTADRTSGVYLAEPVADLIAVTFTAILFAVQFKKALRPLEKKTDAS